MALRIGPCEAGDLAAVRRFMDQEFGRRSERYYAWRLEQCSALTNWVAMLDGECGALVSTLKKTWRIGGEAISIYEIFDWRASARYRGKGLGALVLKRVMDEGLPLMTLGGTDDTLRILPRMGWLTVAEGKAFALPLRGEFIARKLERRGRLASRVAAMVFGVGGPLWFRARRGSVADRWQVSPVTSLDDSCIALYDADRTHGAIATLDHDVLAWAVHGYGRPGQFLSFTLRAEGAPRGWGVCRVVVNEGRRTGEIIDLFVSGDDEEAASALIGEMTTCLAGFQVDAVVTTASCPVVQRALRRNRFITGHSHPLLMFPGRHAAPAAPIHIMRGSADYFLIPRPPPEPGSAPA